MTLTRVLVPYYKLVNSIQATTHSLIVERIAIVTVAATAPEGLVTTTCQSWDNPVLAGAWR